MQKNRFLNVYQLNAINRYTTIPASQAASSGDKNSPAVVSKRILASGSNSSSPSITKKKPLPDQQSGACIFIVYSAKS